MLLRDRRILAVLGLSGTLAVALGMIFLSSQRGATASPEPWPAFEMVYRVETANADSPEGDEFVVRLTYRSRDSWETEVLEALDPRYLGSRTVFDGTHLTATQSFLAAPQVSAVGCDAEPGATHSPAHWLRPIADYPDAAREQSVNPAWQRWVRHVAGDGFPSLSWEYEIDARSKVPQSFVGRSGERLIERMSVSSFRLLPSQRPAVTARRPDCVPEKVQPTAIVPGQR